MTLMLTNLANFRFMTILTAQFPIIGYIRSPLKQKFGIPRQPNLVAVPSILEIVPPFDTPQAFAGLEQFSHIWILWQFHQNRTENMSTFRPQIRPPRLGGNDKIGVFASRSMYRPSNIGLSVVELSNIQTSNGVKLHLLGADMLDGTPVLDIKPYIAYSDSVVNAESGFAQHQPATKQVLISEQANITFATLLAQNSLSKNDVTLIQQLIAQDPRPAYKQTISDRVFIIQYQQFDIGFTQKQAHTLSIEFVKFLSGC